MNQRGLAMIVTMVFLPVVAAGLIWLAAGSSVMARFEGHHQADRAAYSMSAQLASELNELSVLNRKILASHLMVGHLTTYLSFTRYLRDMLQKVGYLVPFGSNIITGGTTLLVQSARIQLQSGIGVALGTQHKWAVDSAEILKSGGTRVFDAARDVAKPFALTKVCLGSICNQNALDAAILSAVPVIEEDPSDYTRLTMQAMNGLPQSAWHLSRQWQQNVLGIVEARRSGGTIPDITGRGFQAADQLEARVKLFFFGFGWRTLVGASATTLVDGFAYRGLPWLVEWQGPDVLPLSIELTDQQSGQIQAESRVRFMGSGPSDMWRPVWRAELTGGV